MKAADERGSWSRQQLRHLRPCSRDNLSITWASLIPHPAPLWTLSPPGVGSCKDCPTSCSRHRCITDRSTGFCPVRAILHLCRLQVFDSSTLIGLRVMELNDGRLGIPYFQMFAVTVLLSELWALSSLTRWCSCRKP